MSEPVELFERQRRLQADADGVYEDLGLNRLADWGEPVRVGSSALGLMVRRDVDVTVVCPSLDEELVRRWARFRSEPARHPRVRAVSLRDDTGPFNTDPDYPDGLYLGVKYRRAPGEDRNLDISGYDIYDAVLHHGVGSVEEFERHHAARAT